MNDGPEGQVQRIKALEQAVVLLGNITGDLISGMLDKRKPTDDPEATKKVLAHLKASVAAVVQAAGGPD